MSMRVVLVHHADSLGPLVDARRPLSPLGLRQAEDLAAKARDFGIAPAAIWHSGKLRARQTAEVLWRVCNPLAEFGMVKGLRSEDHPAVIAQALEREERDIALVSHMPLLPALLWSYLPETQPFPLNGLVLLTRTIEGAYVEEWRTLPDPSARGLEV
jgi:phosphohistidine phosphatase